MVGTGVVGKASPDLTFDGAYINSVSGFLAYPLKSSIQDALYNMSMLAFFELFTILSDQQSIVLLPTDDLQRTSKDF